MVYKLAEEDKLCGVIYPTYEGFSPIPKATCEMLESKCDELDIEINCGGKKVEKPSESQSASNSVSQSNSTSVSTSLSTSESTSKSESISESTSETTSTSLSNSESTSTSESTSVSESTTESTTTSESTSVSTSESASSSTENSNTPEEPKPTPEVTELSDEDIRREVNVQRFFGSVILNGGKIAGIFVENRVLSLEKSIELYDSGIISDLEEKLNKNRPDGSKYKVTAKTTQIKHYGDQGTYPSYVNDIFETVIKVTKPNGEVLELINKPQTAVIDTL